MQKAEIRRYRPDDCEKITKLFYETVHTVNAKDYTEEQLNVWATGKIDLYAWNQGFLNDFTVVAILRGELVGFGNITRTGYLDKLYVHKNHQREGIASAICDALEKSICGCVIETHASITAKPFFEKREYRVIKEQQVERSGIFLTNYIMRKRNLC